MSEKPGNADQVEFWNGLGGARWVAHQEALDLALEPFGRAALAAASPRPDEQVLDVGCGCGWTSLALAGAVGTRVSVLGADVSVPMLALARARAGALSLVNATFVLADASEHHFEPPVDLLFSRFGVMFFRDPVAAFTNLRRTLKPHGRLTFVCWGPVVENPWFRIPMAAAGTVVPLPEPSGPEEPGPFAFADGVRVQRVLEGAGFTRVTLARSTPDYFLGADLDAATTNAVESGPTSRLMVDADDAARAAIRKAVRAAFVPYAKPSGVALAASTWIVQARADG